MNTTLNFLIVFLGPLVAVMTVALVRWILDRDAVALGARLRRWGFWAAIASYGFFAAVMTMSIGVNTEHYAYATGLAAAALFAGLPLGAWAWLRAGGRGLPATVSVAVAGLCALALAVTVSPQNWGELQESGFPLATVVALAIGASAAVWGRRAPIPAGVDLIVAGTVPLGTALVASAAADVVLVEMFAAMPMFALLGLAYVVAARLERGPARPDPRLAGPDRERDRTMAA